MLTRDFRRPKERTRHPLKPLFSHFFLPPPRGFARLDIRLRRATLYPAELRVRGRLGIRQSTHAGNPAQADTSAGPTLSQRSENGAAPEHSWPGRPLA